MTWEGPRNVSNNETSSTSPCVVADPWGGVHLFWDESLDDTSDAGDVIFYSGWDGAGWSKPVDVLMSPEGSRSYAAFATCAVLPNGRLAVGWTGGFGDKIYFSTAPAGNAGDARAWSNPEAIVADRHGATQPHFAVDAQNILHVIYVHYTGENQGIWHLSSADDGSSWTAPAIVPGTYVGKEDASIFYPTFAIDGAGTLHIAWSGSDVDSGYPPNGIFYSRSEDGGTTWSPPVTLAAGPFNYPVLGTRGTSEVHVMWSGTLEQRRKFYQWSSDGGLTWSQTGTIGESGGMQGPAQMAVDGSDQLHLLFISSHPAHLDSLFHSLWLGGGWSEPEELLRGTFTTQNPQYAVAAISGGNTLYTAVMNPVEAVNSDGYQFDIFALRGSLSASAIAPAPLPPTATPPERATSAPRPTLAMTPTPGPAATPGGWARGTAPGSVRPSPVIAGIVSALLVMSAAVLIARVRRR